MSELERFDASWQRRGQAPPERTFTLELLLSSAKQLPTKAGLLRPYKSFELAEDDFHRYDCAFQDGVLALVRGALPDEFSATDKATFGVFEGRVAEKDEKCTLLLGVSNGGK